MTITGILRAQNAWINEFHYDNSNPDANEFVEIVVQNPGLYTLSDFTVSLYQGSNGRFTSETTLDLFTVGDLVGNYQIYYFDYGSIQDQFGGISLDYQGNVLEFISYEGSFTATNGNANGEFSENIGVSESTATLNTESLQLNGTGSVYSDFTWSSAAANTKGSENTSQTLNTVLSTDTDFLTFSFPQQTVAPTIDAVNHTIDCSLINTADLTNQIATFTLSTRATAFISGVTQASGVTSNNYSTTVTYTVIAEDGVTSQDWDVTLTLSALPNAWINEFHYDQSGSDTDEFVEIVVQSKDMFTLSDFTLTLYDGATTQAYGSYTVDGFTEGVTVDDYTYYYLDLSNVLQNGTEGLSLSFQSLLLLFISYEGSFIATDGPASGFTSEDVGFMQGGGANALSSIHLIGNGDTYTDLSWDESIGSNTKGGPNTGFILPVELAYFRGKAQAGYIELEWATISETNNEGFEIERSVDGLEFEYIGYVEGAGNSVDILKYSFEDIDQTSTSYYRLKQIDFDGAIEYHPVIKVDVEFSAVSFLEVYPNPLRDHVNLSVNSMDEPQLLHASLFHVDGSLVFQEDNISLDGLEEQLNREIRTMTTGNYILKTRFTDGEQVVKLVK